jgi:hypothetical protein
MATSSQTNVKSTEFYLWGVVFGYLYKLVTPRPGKFLIAFFCVFGGVLAEIFENKLDVEFTVFSVRLAPELFTKYRIM